MTYQDMRRAALAKATLTDQEKLTKLQIGLAQSSVLLRAGLFLIALPFLIVALVVTGLIFYSVMAAIIGG